MSKALIIVFTVTLMWSAPALGQKSESIHWLSFEQLEDSLAVKPKKVFIEFYTDWCTYCRKMEKKVFTNPQVVDVLSSDYYVVRFDAETEEEVQFGGQRFVNDQLKQSRKPVHQIAQLLASRQGQFVPPTLVVLDEEFNVTGRYFEYMDSEELLLALTNN